MLNPLFQQFCGTDFYEQGRLMSREVGILRHWEKNGLTHCSIGLFLFVSICLFFHLFAC